MRRLHALSGGVPRLLNVIAERALLAGYVHGKPRVDAALVDLAATEVLPPATAPRTRLAHARLVLLLAGAGVLWLAVRRTGAALRCR